jgi:NADH-quinone oxidoreductase subunit J
MNVAAISFIAIVTLSAAFAAATLTRLIHAALSLALTFLGIAAFYFALGAEFVGLAQILVYVGAVAVLIVFTILLTHREDESAAGLGLGGVAVTIAVFGGLFWAVTNTPSLFLNSSSPATITVQTIGITLMTDYVWPLECVGLLLTAALVGALILVMEEKQ